MTETTADIPSHGSVSVVPPIPWLLPREATLFRDFDRAIVAAGNEPDRAERTAALFDGALALSISAFLSTFRPSIVERYEAWRDEYALPVSTELPPMPSAQLKSGVHLGRDLFREMADSGTIHIQTTPPETAITIATVLGGDQSSLAFPSETAIKVDGRKNDGENVTSIWTDYTNDHRTQYAEAATGADIVWCGVAFYDERIYFAIETTDGVYSGHKR